MRNFLIAALAAAIWPVAAQAESVNRSVAVGGKLRIGAFTTINPDCSLVAYPDVRVVSPPSNGQIITTKSKEFVYFPPANPRSACNNRRVQTVLITYKPFAGLAGSDSFSLSLIATSGFERDLTFYVTVK